MLGLLPLRLAVVIGLLAWLAIKLTTAHPLPDWRQGELVMVVPSAEMETDAAFESDLAALFAKHLNVKLRLLRQTSDAAIFSLKTDLTHLATGFRAQSNFALRFSTSYQSLDERVVCNDKATKKIDDLYERKLTVPAESPQEAVLRFVRVEHDDLEWQSRKGTTPVQLLQDVAEGKLDCTVANEEQIATMRNYYPDLNEGMSLLAPSQMAWAIAADGDATLLDEANLFFAQISQDGTLRRLIDRHYGYNERLGTIDTATFIAHARTLLPHYRQWFTDAAELTGLDWRLLAALAYRESRWNPNATSFTHVRGMMMLTEDTADRMGVENRLDARESIMAGARYLQLLKEQLPLRISEQDRLWLALAAYNQGMGHLEDARILAMQSGLNPDVWSDVKRMMPLLSRPAYYEKSKHGKARGGEGVVHVETVRLYHDMLKRLDAQNALHDTSPALQRTFINLVKEKL
ncbi:MAG: membrane-bound lytic murein transglycosylase MltF [Sideroxyarcus sp.]|nr:membrane-bound lytic murein transglycosylase MltF [Sideroxyarcus sp.]